MEYVKNIYDGLYTALVGMKITLEHLFAKKVTNQYPELYHPIESGDMPKNSRNRIFVDMSGCDGCDSCARVCPVNCITVETIRVVPTDEVPLMSDGKKRRMWVSKHEIDFAKCCFCSLCTEACPTEAIYMTQEFEYSTYDKKDLIYNFSDLTVEQVTEKQNLFDEMQEQKKADAEAKKKADAEAKAAAEKAKKEEEAKLAAEGGSATATTETISEAKAELSDEEKEAIRAQKRAEAEKRKAERMQNKSE